MSSRELAGRCAGVGYSAVAIRATATGCDRAAAPPREDRLGEIRPTRVARADQMEDADEIGVDAVAAAARARRRSIASAISSARSDCRAGRRRRATSSRVSPSRSIVRDEIRAERAVDPGRAQDRHARIGRGDRAFAGEFRAAIGADRRRGIVLAIGAVERAVEDIIGRELDERNASAAPPPRATAPAPSRIDRHRELGLGFGLVDGGIGGGVDDRRRRSSASKARSDAVGRRQDRARDDRARRCRRRRRARSSSALATCPRLPVTAMRIGALSRNTSADRAGADAGDPCRKGSPASAAIGQAMRERRIVPGEAAIVVRRE